MYESHSSCSAKTSIIRQTKVEQCLDEDWGFESEFSFNKHYGDAPNPALRLDKLGTVGLPLSDRDADAIKAHAVQAPFGMGERTVVDTSVRDTWEMDAELVSGMSFTFCNIIQRSILHQVAFGNPEWNAFIKRVVKDVCETLGVNIATSAPRCELYKLLLYETGSQ